MILHVRARSLRRGLFPVAPRDVLPNCFRKKAGIHLMKVQVSVFIFFSSQMLISPPTPSCLASPHWPPLVPSLNLSFLEPALSCPARVPHDVATVEVLGSSTSPATVSVCSFGQNDPAPDS